MNILILGAGVMQIPAINKAKEMGHFVLCADGNPAAIGKSLCDIFYSVDIKDKNGLLEIADKFHIKHTLNGVFTIGTDFSSSVAWITEKLNLPGITYQSAMNATDKVRMRQCFKEHRVSSPLYIEYSSEMDIEESISILTFPLVVKPVDSMGSRGVKRVDNLEELKLNIDDSIVHSRTSRAIIEEYIDGPEFSLDALVVGGEVHVFGFADREITFPPYFVEMGHNMPALLDSAKKSDIIRVFSDGIKALGINYGSAKGDMKLGKNGPVIGEIAARLSGGYMSGWTFPYSSGIDLIKGGIELALGLPLSIKNKKNIEKFSSERAIISIPGVIGDIVLPKKKIKGITDNFINIKKGDKVIFPRNNVEKCGNLISAGDTRNIVIKNAEKAVGDILLRLKPSVWETQEFLFNKDSNKTAPQAFDIDFSLIAMLEDNIEIDNSIIYVAKIDKVLKSRKKDWQYRTISQVLKKLKEFYTVEFVEDANYGLDFYTSLLNGSIQGVLYYLDSLEI